MNLDPKISDAGLSSSTSLSTPNPNSQSSLEGQGVRSTSSFGEVLTSQASLFKTVGGKDSLDFAKILSPNVTQASQIIDKEKNMQDALVRADKVFEGNVNQADLQNLIKDSLSYKLATTNPVQAFANDKTVTTVNVLVAQTAMGTQLNKTSVVSRGTSEPFANAQGSKDDVGFEHQTKTTCGIFLDLEESIESDLLNGSSKRKHSQSTPEENDETAELAAVEGTSFVLSQSAIDTSQEMKTNGDLYLKMQSIFGSPEWIEELGQKTAILFSSDKHNAVINLNSDELGPLRILIHLDGDKVNVTFLSNDSQVCEAIASGFEDLRNSLLNAGVQLNQTHVGSSASYQQIQAGFLSSAPQDQPVAYLNIGQKLDLDGDLITSTKIVSFYA
jgi:flagellar hook-length control protein FliK